MTTICGYSRWSSYAANVARGIQKVVYTGVACAVNSSPSSFPFASSTTTATDGRPQFSAAQPLPTSEETEAHRRGNIRFKAVPSTRVGRAAQFGSLFVQLGWDRLTSRPAASGEKSTVSTAGHEKIVETLCRMRGAVLKLGQMLSIQDGSVVPKHISALFTRVRDQAFAMPSSQLQSVLAKEFKNPNWRQDIIAELDETPVAAASIGQVHRAQLKRGVVGGSTSGDRAAAVDTNGTDDKGPEVALKVQYPGVAKSIQSDIQNLTTLLNIGLMPPGLFVDQILNELRTELMEECQYLREADKQTRYHRLVSSHPTLSQFFNVPKVFHELTTQQMLVTEYVRGIPIDQISRPEFGVSLEYRQYVAEQLMTLTLTELFDWRFMQTDPNFSNFIFDEKKSCVHLLDFGAAREYPSGFVDDYLEVVAAAAREDREKIVEKSIDLGFLTGREVPEMINAHVDSVILLGKPFRDRKNNYDFALESIPAQVQKLVPTMVRLRLKPPPMPAYSLHRRLSGTILLCTRLQASIPSGSCFWELYERKQREKNLQEAKV